MTRKRIATAVYTALALTKWFVILSAKHERIRLPFKRKTDCHTPCGGLGGGAFNILKKLGKRLTALAEFFSPFKV